MLKQDGEVARDEVIDKRSIIILDLTDLWKNFEFYSEIRRNTFTPEAKLAQMIYKKKKKKNTAMKNRKQNWKEIKCVCDINVSKLCHLTITKKTIVIPNIKIFNKVKERTAKDTAALCKLKNTGIVISQFCKTWYKKHYSRKKDMQDHMKKSLKSFPKIQRDLNGEALGQKESKSLRCSFLVC